MCIRDSARDDLGEIRDPVKQGGNLRQERQAVVTDRLLLGLSLIHISEPTRLLSISYAVFCLKKKNNNRKKAYRSYKK